MANFSAKPYKVGGSLVITIPAVLIQQKIIDPEKVYNVELTDISNSSGEPQ